MADLFKFGASSIAATAAASGVSEMLATFLKGANVDGTIGNDFLTGTERNDSMYANHGDDWMHGGGGNDYMAGSMGSDTLHGGDGDDELYGNIGRKGLENHEIDQFDGNDRLVGGRGADKLDGGGGIDTAGYEWSEGGVNVTLGDGGEAGIGHSGDAQGDRLFNIENLSGSEHSDYFFGNGVSNKLAGNGGDDHLDGRGGSDDVSGGAGNDTIVSGNGADTVSGGSGADTFVLSNDSTDGSVRVTDFNEAEGDKIDLSWVNVSSFDDIAVSTDENGNAVITVDGRSMVLEGVDADSLDGSEFNFAEGSSAPATDETGIDPNGTCWAPLPELNPAEMPVGDNGQW